MEIAEKEGDAFKCLYFEREYNFNSIYPKISDLGKKQYNYDYDIIKDNIAGKFNLCTDTSSNDIANKCTQQEKLEVADVSSYIANNCGKIYVEGIGNDLGIKNKDLSDRFLTTLILSLFVCLASIGLALFGFLLFRTPGDF